MRSYLPIAFVTLAFPLTGCTTVSRSETMPVRDALAAKRGDIVSFERDGETVPVVGGTPSGEGAEVVTRRGRKQVALGPDDLVTVTREYHKGEVVPGEGVVVGGPSPAMIVTGGALTAVAGGLTALMMGCAMNNGGGGGFGFFGGGSDMSSSCYAFFGPQIAATGATGLVLLVAGLVRPAHVAPSVEVTPMVGLQEAGGVLRVRF